MKHTIRRLDRASKTTRQRIDRIVKQIRALEARGLCALEGYNWEVRRGVR